MAFTNNQGNYANIANYDIEAGWVCFQVFKDVSVRQDKTEFDMVQSITIQDRRLTDLCSDESFVQEATIKDSLKKACYQIAKLDSYFQDWSDNL